MNKVLSVIDKKDGGNAMSLLNRIAISNGNKLRKTAANLAITVMDAKKVAGWNRSLRSEIHRKAEGYPTGLVISSHPRRTA